VDAERMALLSVEAPVCPDPARLGVPKVCPEVAGMRSGKHRK